MASAVGQELSSAGKYGAAVKVLEAAHTIGTESPRLQSSLLQALGMIYALVIYTRTVYMYVSENVIKMENSKSDFVFFSLQQGKCIGP